MGLAEEIQRLRELKEDGTISEVEFQEAKWKLIQENRSAPNFGITQAGVNTWCLVIHLSQFLGYVVPLAGWIGPIVIWQIKKTDSPVIDLHGRIVANWILSEIIYFLVAALLTLVFIGIPLMLVLVAVSVIFPIIGGIKASAGDVWPYPFSIRFFGLDEHMALTHIRHR